MVKCPFCKEGELIPFIVSKRVGVGSGVFPDHSFKPEYYSGIETLYRCTNCGGEFDSKALADLRVQRRNQIERTAEEARRPFEAHSDKTDLPSHIGTGNTKVEPAAAKVSLFLSHSHTDKDFARRLAKDLEKSGIRVWMDEAEIMVGDSLIEKIGKAINEMDYLGVILSKNSVKSKWVRKEVNIAITQEIKGKRVKVLPFLLDNCDIPSFLSDKVYADFRVSLNYEKELARIVLRVSQHL